MRINHLQLDRGALLHVYEVSDPAHRAWLATHYSDLRSRPFWEATDALRTYDDPAYDPQATTEDDRRHVDHYCAVVEQRDWLGKPQLVFTSVALPVPFSFSAKLIRTDCGRRIPRAPTIDERDAEPMPGRRVL